MYSIGKINQKIYKCITEDIITEEVIIIDNQIQHIKDRHPEAYNKVLKNIQEAISTPGYIIRDKHAYKNSVISCWKISERRLQNYLRNKEILYSRK